MTYSTSLLQIDTLSNNNNFLGEMLNFQTNDADFYIIMSETLDNTYLKAECCFIRLGLKYIALAYILAQKFFLKKTNIQIRVGQLVRKGHFLLQTTKS